MALTETLKQNALDKIDGKKDSVSLIPGGKNVNGSFVANVPKLPAPEISPVNTIDAGALSTASSTPLSTPTPTSSDYQEFQSFLSSVVPANTALSDRRTQLSDQIRASMATIGTKGARQQQLEAEAGIPESMTQLQELNTTIANLTKSYGEAIVNEEGVARPQEFITGRQDFLQKKKTAEVEALTAVAEALQGNITLAENAAEKAVNFEFADEEAELEALWFEFTANKDDLTREDTKAARELENYIGERARVLGEKKAERAGAIAIAQEAAINGAPSDLIARIAKAATQEEALALGGSYIGLMAREAQYASIRSANASAALNELQLRKEQAIQDAVSSGAIVLNEDQQKTAMSLGKQFEDESKGFKTQVDAFNRILASSENPSAAGDLSLIFAYMKMLDPTSVVRETEFANAQNAAGVPEQIRAQYNKVRSGERLTDVTRNDFINRSTSIYSSALDQQVQLEDQFRTQATDLYNLPPEAAELVIRDIRSAGAATSEVVFSTLLNQADDDQIRTLQEQGLLPMQSFLPAN